MDDFSVLWQKYGAIIIRFGVALLLFVLFFIASKLFYKKIIPYALKKENLEKHPVIFELLTGFSRPLAAYLKFTGICIALFSLTSGLQTEKLPWSLGIMVAHAPAFLTRALRIGTVVAVAWGFISSSGITCLLLHNARHKLDIPTSKSVTRFLSAVFNVVVVAIAVVVILSELNYDINGLIAGLGLGGLTIALAAKDSAANFFGGLVLVMEKPFEIGDWISCNNVEGTVEDINLRSTKVRTIAGSLTVVPNSLLAAAPITNWSGAMEKRRAEFVLNVVYSTSQSQLKSFIAKSKEMLHDNPDILDDSIVVCFSDFSESSLDIRFIFYTALPGYADHLAIKERVNYALMDLAQEYDIHFAFPTQTIHLEKTGPS